MYLFMYITFIHVYMWVPTGYWRIFLVTGTHACMHSHLYAYTYTHTYMDVCVYTYIRTHTYMGSYGALKDFLAAGTTFASISLPHTSENVISMFVANV